jgi:hypothetical protein
MCQKDVLKKLQQLMLPGFIWRWYTVMFHHSFSNTNVCSHLNECLISGKWNDAQKRFFDIFGAITKGFFIFLKNKWEIKLYMWVVSLRERKKNLTNASNEGNIQQKTVSVCVKLNILTTKQVLKTHPLKGPIKH